jgi:hypothetical protein
VPGRAEVPQQGQGTNAGETLRLHIILDVTYPQDVADAIMGFANKKHTIEHTTDLHLATVGAGRQYTLWWWLGGGAGLALVLLAESALIGLAGGQRRHALSTRVIPYGDEQQPPAVDLPK